MNLSHELIMYSKSCGSSRVDEARHHLFSNGTKSLENLPPTQAALIQHIKRALLQASFYWNQATAVQQDIPEFNAWGWFRDSTSKTWEPYWTNLRDASKACTILLHCGCKTACRWHCKCCKAGVRCTSICACEGACTNNDGEDNERSGDWTIGSGALAKSFQYPLSYICAKFAAILELEDRGVQIYWLKPGPFSGGGHIGFGRHLGPEGRWLRRPS
ncbi:unnamed protein product [Leuciscus chuanchicus]